MSDNPWKDALEDAAIVSWIYTAANKDDPAQMLADLLTQSRREVLDPQVSEAAAKLVEAAQRAALEQVAQYLKDRLYQGYVTHELIEGVCGDIRDLIPSQSAPAPKCPKCGRDMQRGDTWLCIYDGTTSAEQVTG